MASMKRPRLATVTALPGFTLSLSFIDGSRHTVSLAEDVVNLPGLKPLQDDNAFAGVVIADGGWVVEWPAFDIQIGADTLWLDAQAQSANDPATREFLAWRSRNGLSLSSAASAIGLTPRTVSAYGTGKRPVPRYIVLACKGWEAERQHH